MQIFKLESGKLFFQHNEEKKVCEKVTRSSFDVVRMSIVVEKAAEEGAVIVEEIEDEEEEEDVSWSSDSEIGDALDYLDSKDDDEAVEGAFTLQTRRPNAHGGLHSRPNTSSLQPLSNRNQKFSNHIRASPLEVYKYLLVH